MTDPAELLELARRRDPTALATIFDTYSPKIYAYIYRHVRDAQLAEDLTSTVFIKMLEALDRGKFATDALQSWLYRIAHNAIIDDVRYHQRRPAGSLHDGMAQPAETHPDHQVELILRNERLLEAVSQLTDDQRDVILLRFGEGMTAPQVATILDKTEEAVRALQRRGLANLRKILSPVSTIR
ncbi:MAG: sigma-70 family RNA polymerase sigma factor [Caldilineales bacterium]|nr:sigma-70 family RNA polymerase sigma factor [Caldilineales bacterium]